MKRSVVLAGAAALALAVATSASAAEVKLAGVTFPEGKKISVPFTRTAIAPKAATLEGTMRMEKGQVDVKLSWKMMEPAVMFAGNITTYNVWAVTVDGRPENLGELRSGRRSQARQLPTGKVTFAIMVTADVLPGTVIPSELVLFTSGKVDPTKAKSEEFSVETSSMIGEFTRPGNPSIADLTYAAKGSEPIELQQADKASNLAVELKAETVAARRWTPPRPSSRRHHLSQGRLIQAVVDYSRRALDSSGTAVRLKVQQILDERLAAEAARVRAAEERKRQELEAAKAQAAAAEAEKAAPGGRGRPPEGRAGAAEGQHPRRRRAVHAGRGDGPRPRRQHGRHPVRREQVHPSRRTPSSPWPRFRPSSRSSRRSRSAPRASRTRRARRLHTEALDPSRDRLVIAAFLVAEGARRRPHRARGGAYGPANPPSATTRAAEAGLTSWRVGLIQNRGPVTCGAGRHRSPGAPGRRRQARRQAGTASNPGSLYGFSSREVRGRDGNGFSFIRPARVSVLGSRR
ncbi:MAG: hypothetical protein IPF66_14860, partial [Holophagales bacterium]|nr:hypothetical protein [Holophagales bacterium]